MKTSIRIDRPLPAVWEYFCTASNWQAWWGGALIEVVPAWEEGAILRWSMGEPMRLVHFIPRRQAGLQGKWMETIFRFEPTAGGGSAVEVEIEPRGGASFPDDGQAHLQDINEALDRLKRLLEGRPLPARQPVFPAEPAPPPATEPTPLRGRSYLALMSFMVGVGFILALIPFLVVNTLFSGGLAAWLWVRREGTPHRLRVRRGLLAGMLAGVGGTLVGSLFFLWNIAQGDLAAIVGAVSAALALFLLPAALGGVLMGLVLRRQKPSEAARLAAEASIPAAPAPVRAGAELAPDRTGLQNRLRASAQQGLSRLPETTAAEATRRLVEQVMQDEALGFAVDAALEKLPECLRMRTPLSTAQVFQGCLVAVSVFPAWTPEQLRALLPESYLSLVQELAAPYQVGEAHLDMAHWVVASDGSLTSVYLTAIPHPEGEQAAPALIARELLTEQERSALGI